MAIEVEPRDENGVRILAISGDLDARASTELQRTLLACLGEKVGFMLLDLSALETISGAGIRVFVMIRERLEAEGGELVLSTLRPEVKQVFEVGGMTGRFTFEASRASGLRNLQRAAKIARKVNLAGDILAKKGEAKIQRKSPSLPARAAKRSSLAVELLKGKSDPSEE